MFELVICRRQVVRGGEDTKLLLYRWKPKFGSLCELGKLCLNVYLQGIFFFFSELVQMFIMVYTDNATLLIWRALQIDPDTWKKKILKHDLHNMKAGRKKKVGARALKCRSELKSKAFRMKEMMIYLSNTISLLLRLKLPKRKYNIDYIDCQQQQWQNQINSWGSYSIIKWKASSSRLHHTDRLQVCFHGCVFKIASPIFHPHTVCLRFISNSETWQMYFLCVQVTLSNKRCTAGKQY